MIKVALKIVVGIVLLLAGLLVWMNWPVKLSVPQATQAMTLPIPGNSVVEVSVLESGYIESQHAMNVRGGDWRPFRSGVMAVLIEHPQGRYLIDAGLGSNATGHFARTPALMQAVARLHIQSNTLQALQTRGLKPEDLNGILLTHAHWDHTSGLEDLPGVPVFARREEIAFMHSGDAAVELVSEWLDNVQLQALAFADGPFAGFASSHDVFGDGAVVLLPMSGHTPGSMAVLVQQANGRTLLFIGDTAWAHEGVDWPAEKPWISRQLVDHNAADVVSQLVHLHQLQQINPGLQIIPAHDQRRYGLVEGGAR